MKRLLLATTVVVGLVLFACNKSNTNNIDYAANAVCVGTPPTYNRQIGLLLQTNCATAGCHGAGSLAGRVNLDGYANASQQFKNNRRVLASIHHETGVAAMPKGLGKLSNTEINLLNCWVKNGCPE